MNNNCNQNYVSTFNCNKLKLYIIQHKIKIEYTLDNIY